MDGKEASSGSSGNKKQGHLPREKTPQQGCLRSGASGSHNFSLSLPCLKNNTGPLKMVHLQKYIPFSQQVPFHLQMSTREIWGQYSSKVIWSGMVGWLSLGGRGVYRGDLDFSQ